MRAAILTIGDELISGLTADTNSAYLARSLVELGIAVSSLSTVGDHPADISRELDRVSSCSDVVLVTGGLGPTEDDVTKQSVAKALGLQLRLDPDLHRRLLERFEGHASATPEVVENLAMIPEGAETLPNPVGAAVGLLVRVGDKRVYILPGVPREMEAVFETGVRPDLLALPKTEVVSSRLIKTTGLRESAIAGMLRPAVKDIQASVGYLPRLTGVDLSLKATACDEGRAARILEEATGKVLAVLGRHVYSTDGLEIHQVVGDLLIKTGTTLAVAESCTGGLIGHLLTEVPGISACLDRVVVSYSNSAKVECLGVSEETLKAHGAVSRETAEEMARGVREAAGTDIGISTTGIAGPGGGTDEKPVGLVHFGLAVGSGLKAHHEVFNGSRGVVKRRAAAVALDMLRRQLLDLKE
jgi:nicotinamide-nucleotide amidase